jgi:hypothetical protein
LKVYSGFDFVVVLQKSCPVCCFFYIPFEDISAPVSSDWFLRRDEFSASIECWFHFYSSPLADDLFEPQCCALLDAQTPLGPMNGASLELIYDAHHFIYAHQLTPSVLRSFIGMILCLLGSDVFGVPSLIQLKPIAESQWS